MKFCLLRGQVSQNCVKLAIEQREFTGNLVDENLKKCHKGNEIL